MPKEQLSPNLEDRIRRSAEIPNAPFLYEPARRFVLGELENMGFSEKDSSLTELEYDQDDFALYARVRFGSPTHKIIITTHLDHPYIVLDGKGGGTPLGSMGNDRLKKNAERHGVPIRVFSRLGEEIAKDVIVSTDIDSRRPKIGTEFKQKYEPNSQGIWDLEPIIIERDRIKMINADNMVSTAICLSLLQNLVSRRPENIEVEFVFSYLEEIKQVSATGIALRGSTPFGEINPSSLIIVLESASVEASDEIKTFLNSQSLSLANYENGILVRVNDRDIIYGQRFDGKNRAENLLLGIADSENIRYQQSLVSGTCEATVYSLFTNTANIVGVVIPTKYKHNWGPGGEITHEELSISDVNDATALLMGAITRSTLPGDHPMALSEKLKRSQLAASEHQIEELKKDRITTYLYSRQRLRHARFYPDTISRQIAFNYSRAMGKLSTTIR